MFILKSFVILPFFITYLCKSNSVKVNIIETVFKVCHAVQMVHKLEVIKLTDDDVWANEQTQDVFTRVRR